MNGFLKRLHRIIPEHDTPVGLIHPYWARKPLNVVQELVSCFSEEGDLIADPFVGSGTTVFAALSQNRKIVAADINPLAIFLTKSIIELRQSPKEKLDAIKLFVEDFSREVLPWYHYRDNLYVERERFQVIGELEEGNFKLINSEVVLKSLSNGKLKGRNVEIPDTDWVNRSNSKSLLCCPLNFEKLNLLPNSRIAIPNGATLAHYYERKNQAAINLALQLITSEKYGVDNIGALKLLLSATLPLLRLSDKKASSQWPYWRPKKHLTSRNPIPILQKKYQAVNKAATWLKNHLKDEVEQNLSEYLNLYNVSVQCLSPQHIEPEKVDLIITDPPYSDHAPYLEYSSLWMQILDLKLPNNAFKHEIVQTDAPDRINDTNDYANRLQYGLRTCLHILKPEGILIWFYQDHCVDHWALISKEASINNAHILEVVPMAKQRRSMKTVMSPGKTLDGDLILIFKKKTFRNKVIDTSEQAINLLEKSLESMPDSANYFEKYASIVEVGLKYNLMECLSTKFSDIREILDVIDRRENVLAS